MKKEKGKIRKKIKDIITVLLFVTIMIILIIILVKNIEITKNIVGITFFVVIPVISIFVLPWVNVNDIKEIKEDLKTNRFDYEDSIRGLFIQNREDHENVWQELKMMREQIDRYEDILQKTIMQNLLSEENQSKEDK